MAREAGEPRCPFNHCRSASQWWVEARCHLLHGCDRHLPVILRSLDGAVATVVQRVPGKTWAEVRHG